MSRLERNGTLGIQKACRYQQQTRERSHAVVDEGTPAHVQKIVVADIRDLRKLDNPRSRFPRCGYAARVPLEPFLRCAAPRNNSRKWSTPITCRVSMRAKNGTNAKNTNSRRAKNP